MGEIYGNSFLTIATTSVESETERILVPRDESFGHNTLDLNLDGQHGSRRLVGMAADTHLKPYEGNFLHGEALPPTQRLAPGDAMPFEGWASTIYCLLLGVGQSRCECFVLGLSARMLNAFGRLGIIGSIPPSVFASRAVGNFVLV
jgi:hypothetical protein